MLCLKLANSSVILAVLVSDIGWGAKPPKCHLAPTVKHTGQESGGELCEIFKFDRFCTVKICKQCLQTASASDGQSPQTPCRGFAPGLHHPNESSWRRHCILDRNVEVGAGQIL